MKQEITLESEIHNLLENTEPRKESLHLSDHENISDLNIDWLENNLMNMKNLYMGDILNLDSEEVFPELHVQETLITDEQLHTNSGIKRGLDDTDKRNDEAVGEKRQKVAYTPVLSPLSLASTSMDEELKSTGITVSANGGASTSHTVIVNTAPTVPVVPTAPKKLTNEFTMQQVGEMKQRMINTHKLLLNFNLLKDSYTKTCIELKKAVTALKDTEIHRAHLLIENQQLKKQLNETKEIK